MTELLGRVAEVVEGGCEIPQALRVIMGEVPTPRAEVREAAPSWEHEPADILFGKPANAEQLELVRQLQQHDAILVQGPPGTGKSHTIANLIGHLTASGSRVLVTSQKGKALSVLRKHLIPELRPLAVSIIAEEGSKPLEEAVDTLLQGRSRPEREVREDGARLAARRAEAIVAVEALRRDILACVQGEYREVVTGAGSCSPIEAAVKVAKGLGTHDWIPGTLTDGVCCPLDEQEVSRLYHLTAELRAEAEQVVIAGLPATSDLLSSEEFQELITLEQAGGTANNATAWAVPLPRQPTGLTSVLEQLESAWQDVCAMRSEVEGLEGWEEGLVDGALAAEERPQWLSRGLESIAAWRRLREANRERVLRHQVALRSGVDAHTLSGLLEQELKHCGAGRKLSVWRRLFSRDTRRLLDSITVNGRPVMNDRLLAVARDHLASLEEAALLRRTWTGIMPPGTPELDDDEGRCFAIQRRLEDRAALVQRYRHLRLDLPGKIGLAQAVLTAGGPTSIQAFPLLGQARTELAFISALLEARLAEARALEARHLLDAFSAHLTKDASPLAQAIRQVVAQRDLDEYRNALDLLERLRALVPAVTDRNALLDRLRPWAPQWAAAVSGRQEGHQGPEVPGEVPQAWEWRQLAQELEARHGADIGLLQRRLSEQQTSLQQLTRKLIQTRTWQHLLSGHLPRCQQALLSYMTLMRQYGKGTGKWSSKLLAQAREALEGARDAVPIWIMPMQRVFEAFTAAPCMFDVVIVDEASQCDLVGLLAYFLGRKVIVVGDHEQVSPVRIGTTLEATDQLLKTHLQDVPANARFRADESIYEFARGSFGGQLRLVEHFRCVPDIIAFSNKLAYGGAIRALRPASAAPQPHLVEHIVQRVVHSPDRANRSEALWITALVSAMTQHDGYQERSLGVVSLLYDEQVKLLGQLLLKHIPADAWAAHKLDFGSPSQFQGDERDVMLLSLVSTPREGVHSLLAERTFKSRFNVAASRARDQLWLVHSVDPNIHLQPQDLRRQLIEHVRDPGAARRLFEERSREAESVFEREVIEHLVHAGYATRAQVQVGYYRIDIVVECGDKRVALECDGERWHTLEDLPNDMARQATLERMGWRFIRLRGSHWYRTQDRSPAWEWLQKELAGHGILPSNADPSQPAAEQGEVVGELKRLAVRNLLDWGYPEVLHSQAPPPEPADLAGTST